MFVLALIAVVHDGQPLAAHDFWSAWSFDPAVVIGLGLTGALYLKGVSALWRSAGGGHGIRRWEAASFAGGWLILLLALMSPLHRLGSVLFSAHMVQHELLMVAAAPLLVLGHPLIALVWAVSPRWRRIVGKWSAVPLVRHTWALLTLPLVAWTLHAGAIWLWHAPALFQATVRSDLVHSLQHVTFLGTGLLFWWALLRGHQGRLGRPAAALYLFTTSVHTTILGALLTFSPRVWYPIYASDSLAWGLTPLEDQQLAGLIMWVPAGLAYLIATLAIVASWLNQRVPASAIALQGSLFLSGCGSSDQQLRKLEENRDSWNATAQLTAELRQRGAVPEVYARQTLAAAREESDKAREKLERQSR